MKNIAIFFGGTTVEHDISCITGVMTLHSIDRELFNPIPIYISKDGIWYTGKDLFEIENFKKLKVENLYRVSLKEGDNKLLLIKKKRIKELGSIYSAINCMHGLRGEDGSLAGLLNFYSIPLASPNLISSGIAIDKDITKKTLKGIGVKTLPCKVLKSENDILTVKDKLKYPVIIKPATLGSSIGIETAKNKEEFLTSSHSAFRYDSKIIVEPKLENIMEINCSAYQDECGNVVVSECERPISKDEILSFNDKYNNGEREFPAKIDIDISDKIKEITKKVYLELDYSGIIRIDFFVKDKEVFVNEINSVPGSLAYYLFTPSLKEFSKILTSIIMKAV
ncbi:MAG: ATP-grasp domain-containing protein, partial [Firmicutes bacterium]|nr:ATP-grasp domain-containing protein [Candidatus Caballimonas caccae]